MKAPVRELAALLALALFTLIFYAPLLFGDRSVLAFYDNAVQTVPWYTFEARWLSRGVLPLWDPTQFGGHTFIGDALTGLFYPPHLLLFWLVGDSLSPRWITGSLVFHAFLAAAFQYALLRVLGVGRIAAIVAGMAYAFAGFLFFRMSYQADIYISAVWLPLVFLLFHLALRRTLWLAPATGAALALSFLAGHIQPPAFAAVTLALYAAWFAATARPRPQQALRAAAALVVTAVTMVGVAAVQLVPSLEYQERALRWIGEPGPVDPTEKIPYDIAGHKFALPPSEIDGFLSPRLSNIEDVAPYAGAVTLALAALGLLWGGRARVAFWGLLALFWVLFTFGHQGGVHRVMYELVPFLDKVREAGRGLLIVQFALAALAGFGVAALARQPVRTSGRAAAVVLAAVGAMSAAVAIFGLADGIPIITRTAWIVALALIVLVAAIAIARWTGLLSAPAAMTLCAVALAIELLPVGWHWFPEVDGYNGVTNLAPERYYDEHPGVRFLRSRPGKFRVDNIARLVSPNAGQVFGLELLVGHGATMDRSFFDFWQLGPTPPSRVNDVLNVQYSISPSPIAGWRRVFGFQGGAVYENPTRLPRARVVADWEVAPVAAHKDRLLATDFPYRSRVLVEEMPSAPVPRATGGSAQVLRYEPNEVEIEATTNGSALLVVSELWYPGWRASVDGKPAELLRANGVLRAVAVPRGTHRVEMRYRPTHWSWALAASLLSIVVVLSACVLSWRRFRLTRRRPAGANQSP